MSYQLKSDKVFDLIVSYLQEQGSQLVKQIRAIFHFQISIDKKHQPTTWTLDLKNNPGQLVKGKQGIPDVSIYILDEDLISIVNGTLRLQSAYINIMYTKGKIKMKGNIEKLRKFKPDILPKIPKL